MISHKHKCIFIHIPKCAGSSVERAFGIDVYDNTPKNECNLFGWNQEHGLYLQHATPQELLDFGFVTQQQWDSYYKFIIVRNPWSRAVSDYFWLSEKSDIKDSFSKFIRKEGRYEGILRDTTNWNYRGDHLKRQHSYFLLNEKEIKYDKVVRFEELKSGISDLEIDEEIKKNIINSKVNSSKKIFVHYSDFYNKTRRRLISKIYKEDIDYLSYEYEEKRNLKGILFSQLPSKYFLRNI